ncbi:YbaB/EbfC family nucleoid-associated protein [Glycomyces arizonensis]|uniref:YbaB/EbfC family nucleoid-associated protein n=1 Tax=Glycomyces arizonensis TaxID=256035 RepID=UPI0004189C77|nr:YbaB/EbfC family nucleoid-associated protein [Glycomyces arizonensis]
MSDDRLGGRTPEAVFADLERLLERTEDRLATLEAAEDEVLATPVSVTSDDGMVTVALDTDGRLDRVALEPRAVRLRGTLPQIVLDTLERARLQYAELAQEAARRALPGLNVDAPPGGPGGEHR